MKIIRIDRLNGFGNAHADARKALAAWLAYVEHSNWKTIQEVRRNYPHADAVRAGSGIIVTIFNIRGNRYRLLTAIDYSVGVVNILKVMTHAESIRICGRSPYDPIRNHNREKKAACEICG